VTGKNDFDAEEWKVVLEGPMTAGMIVITAEKGGTFRETFGIAHAYNDARKQHGQSELLDEIAGTRPEFDRHRFGSPQELHDKGLDEVSQAVSIIRAKATPDELEAYRAFVLSVAEHAAKAHKEHGQEVSGSEQAALDEIRARLSSEA
jgi:hypothetical protein